MGMPYAKDGQFTFEFKLCNYTLIPFDLIAVLFAA